MGFSTLPTQSRQSVKSDAPITNVSAEVVSVKPGQDDTTGRAWYVAYFEFTSEHADGTVTTTRPTGKGTGVSFDIGDDDGIAGARERGLRLIAQGEALIAMADALAPKRPASKPANTKPASVKPASARAAAMADGANDDAAMFN